LGTDQYWRLRIGIGHPGVKSEVANWVLKKPAPDQRTAIEDCITRTSLALPHLLSGDITKATQMIHTAKPPRPKPPRQDKPSTNTTAGPADGNAQPNPAPKESL
jgi:PTH1 family peptidyl-tRNA hydrolase